MAAYNPFLELSGQLGYVQCGFCATILLVSVPCSSNLLKMVTVKCGHCACLLSVSLAGASFVPMQFLASLGDEEENQQACGDHVFSKARGDGNDSEEDEEGSPVNLTVNKPPEKRQRAPSAYNRFIKEEIQRIKAREPNITHKQAFSTAAKNWAHFPRSQHSRGKGESCSSLGEGKRPIDGDQDEGSREENIKAFHAGEDAVLVKNQKLKSEFILK